MMYNKKTAVDWLIEQLQAPCRSIPARLIKQAKEIEKEQINKAFYDGYYQEELYNAKEYYNKTYGK